MNHKQWRNRSLTRLLSLVLALVLCTGWTVAVAADETDEEVTETIAATEVTEAAEAAEEEVELVLAAVTAEQIWQAKQAWEALLPEQVKAEQAEFLADKRWEDTFCRVDVLEALQLHTQALEYAQELADLREQLQDRLAREASLDQGQRTIYSKAIQDQQTQLGEYDPEALVAALEALGQAPVDTEEINTWMETAQAQLDALNGLFAVLDTVELQNTNAKLTQSLEDYLRLTSGKETQARRTCQELLSNLEAVEADTTNYFTLDAQAQKELPQRIRDLSEELSQIPLKIAAENAGNVKTQEQQMEKLSGKQLFAYIALGLGVVALIVAVVATVLTLPKGKEKPAIEVETLASREAVERLDSQNRILKQALDAQDRKLDAQVEKLADQMKKLADQAQKLGQQEIALRDLEAYVKKLEKDPLPSSPPVGYLTLNYVSYAPNTSYLTRVEGKSEYLLYEDDTVEYKPQGGNSLNQLSGWSSIGLLYLFAPEVNGAVIPAEKYQQHGEFFQVKGTKQRAKVKAVGGNYVLEAMGRVAMEKL